MGKLKGLALLALPLTAVPAPVMAETPLERQVLETLNHARTDPVAYAETLRKYRSFFRANIVSLPGEPADFETAEGVAVVDDAIAFLGRQAAMAPLASAPVLEASSADLVREQATSGDTGHDGGDGSSPGDRVRRRGGGAFVAEVIAYGAVDAVDVVRQLIVDDGVADRGHRTILYDPHLRFAGVSCGAHPEYRTMCVIDLAVTPDGQSVPTRVVRAELPVRNGH